MKTLLSASGFFAAFATALFLAAGCSEKPVEPTPPPTPDPELNVDESASSLSFSYVGGAGVVTYYVTNPAEDGQVVASVDEASASWLQDVQVDEANGTVGYTVAANLGTDSRSATLSIVYTWDEGEESLNKTVTIQQTASPNAEAFAFELGTVTHNSASVTVTPADPDIEYLVMYMTEEEFEKGYATDDQIYETAMKEFAAAAGSLGYTSMREYFENEDVLYKGTATISWTEVLAPETGYRVIAIGTTLDMQRLTPMVSFQFTTAAAPQQGLQFEFTYNDGDAGMLPTVTVTPSDDTAWYYCEAQPAAILDGGSAEGYIDTYWVEGTLDTFMSLYGYTVQETIEMTCSQGESTCWTYGTGEYFVFAFAPDPETGYVTDLKYEFFTVNEDNTVTVQQQ